MQSQNTVEVHCALLGNGNLVAAIVCGVLQAQLQGTTAEIRTVARALLAACDQAEATIALPGRSQVIPQKT